MADPTCAYGVIGGNVCCLARCGTCGGSGCSRRPGGASNCCGGAVLKSGRSCNEYPAPCIIEPQVATQPQVVVAEPVYLDAGAYESSYFSYPIIFLFLVILVAIVAIVKRLSNPSQPQFLPA